MFKEALYKLSAFAFKADVKTEMRISISFSTPQDKAYFISEVSREFEPLFNKSVFGEGNHTDFKLYGIHVRIV